MPELDPLKASDGERALQTRLRQLNLPEPEWEYEFFPSRRWRFDCAWPDRRLAIEVEGGLYTGGRHVRGEGYEDDLRKYNAAMRMGWVVLRFSPLMLNYTENLDLIATVYQARIDVWAGVDHGRAEQVGPGGAAG